MEWLKLTFSTTPEQVGLLTAELWALGSKGTQERAEGQTILVSAFFEAPSSVPVARVSRDRRYWTAFGAHLESVETIVDSDWSESYRRSSKPFALGSGFLVDPREPGDEPRELDHRRVLLRLPARRAFGTGTHESTRLVVEWLEDLDLEGLQVLDVGTGTGILGFVALCRGAASVLGIEIDLTATVMAASNQRLNERLFPLVAGTVEAVAVDARFDLVLVNVLPGNIDDSLPRILDLVEDRGRAIFSGIVQEVAPGSSRRLEEVGFAVVGRRQIGDWEAVMTAPDGR